MKSYDHPAQFASALLPVLRFLMWGGARYTCNFDTELLLRFIRVWREERAWMNLNIRSLVSKLDTEDPKTATDEFAVVDVSLVNQAVLKLYIFEPSAHHCSVDINTFFPRFHLQQEHYTHYQHFLIMPSFTISFDEEKPKLWQSAKRITFEGTFFALLQMPTLSSVNTFQIT